VAFISGRRNFVWGFQSEDSLWRHPASARKFKKMDKEDCEALSTRLSLREVWVHFLTVFSKLFSQFLFKPYEDLLLFQSLILLPYYKINQTPN
jgi:hypothetical protein